jgi:hypothetical protein
MIDWGKRPYVSPSDSYLDYMGEITEQEKRSQGVITDPAFKKPYCCETYQSMMYLFDNEKGYKGSIAEAQEAELQSGYVDTGFIDTSSYDVSGFIVDDIPPESYVINRGIPYPETNVDQIIFCAYWFYGFFEEEVVTPVLTLIIDEEFNDLTGWVEDVIEGDIATYEIDPAGVLHILVWVAS